MTDKPSPILAVGVIAPIKREHRSDYTNAVRLKHQIESYWRNERKCYSVKVEVLWSEEGKTWITRSNLINGQAPNYKTLPSYDYNNGYGSFM